MLTKPFLTHALLQIFSIAQAEFFICCKPITRLSKNVFFISNFYVPRYENCLPKCPIFRFVFKVQNLAIFGRFQSEVKTRFRAIFSHFCVVTVIPNLHVKDHFNWPSRLSPRVMWICPGSPLNLLRPQRENRNSTICWISQNQKLPGEF